MQMVPPHAKEQPCINHQSAAGPEVLYLIMLLIQAMEDLKPSLSYSQPYTVIIMNSYRF